LSGSGGGEADDWRPTASLAAIGRRAELLRDMRRFFAERSVLEVETPVLAAAAACDLHIGSLATELSAPVPRRLYLQSSPEYAMKRLLAAGSGPIYQIARAFRDAEAGRLHNPEFTLLEWYRPGFDQHALMDEVAALLEALLGSGEAERLEYRQAFRRHAGLDPFSASDAELAARVRALGGDGSLERPFDRDACLDLVLSEEVQPKLGPGPVFVYDFPASQASLARVRAGDPPLAERFELYVGGLEIANGYRELTDPREQRSRFEADRAARHRRGLAEVPLDERLLAALEAGLPESAGVALGVDRLVMVAIGATHIGEALAFPVERA